MADPRLPFGFGPPPELLAAIPQLHAPNQMAMQPNGLPDLSNTPVFGRQGFEAGMNEFLPELMPMALGPLGRVAGMAPRTVAGVGALLMAPSQAGGQPSESVRELQIRLRDAGYYRGPIDGRMGEGTQKAQEAYDAAELERQRLKTQQDAAAAQKAETEQKRQAEERRAQERKAGDDRLREMEENAPWYREWAGPMGLGIGFGLGMLTRGKVVKASNRASATAADRANQVMSGTPPTDLADRVGRVNRFWSEGQRTMPFGPAPAEPFVSAPRTRYGFKANPEAPTGASLYQPDRVRNFGTDAGIAGFGAIESAVANDMADSWRQELSQAQDALGKDPSEANIQRVQHALNQVALYEGASRVGLGLAGGYGSAALKMRRSNIRPDVNVADSERLRINELLASRGKPIAKRKKP